MIMWFPSQYNCIIGRPRTRLLQIVPSTAHEMLKFPTKLVIITLHSAIVEPMECKMLAGFPSSPSQEEAVVKSKGIKAAIHPEYLDHAITIGGSLSEKRKVNLCESLKGNLDVFTWKPSDMIGVPRHVSEHRPNVTEGCPR